MTGENKSSKSEQAVDAEAKIQEILRAFGGKRPLIDDIPWFMASKTTAVGATGIGIAHIHHDNNHAVLFGIVKRQEDGSVKHVPDNGILAFTLGEWEAFTAGAKDGEFNPDVLPSVTPPYGDDRTISLSTLTRVSVNEVGQLVLPYDTEYEALRIVRHALPGVDRSALN